VKCYQLLRMQNDTEIYGFCSPSEVYTLHDRISVCFDSVSDWILANRLQLNPKVMQCSSARRQH